MSSERRLPWRDGRPPAVVAGEAAAERAETTQEIHSVRLTLFHSLDFRKKD